MARLPKTSLLDILIRAVESCGWRAIIESNRHPFHLRVFSESTAISVRVYIWNVTHGGGQARAPDEFRIQITGVDSIDLVPDRTTLLLGWDQDYEVFVGFDTGRHAGAVSKSPSIQVKEKTLVEASKTKWHSQDKGNGEVVFAFQPSFITEYISNQKEFHRLGDDPASLAAINTISSTVEALTEVEAVSGLAEERQKTVTQLYRYTRSTSFRDRVLRAYAATCSFCGLQLNLVDAAHILPVAFPGASDQTSNGIALCALHHRAFDAGLVSFSKQYKTDISPARLNELRGKNLLGGLQTFRDDLRPVILLPPDKRDWPAGENITRGREIRGW
jgi:putative restriction endonuclease